jgi:adenosine deaminase
MRVRNPATTLQTRPDMPDMRWLLVPGLFVAACATQPSDDGTDQGAADGYDSSAATKRENAVAKKFEDARNDPAALAKLVAKLPKGADLHMHLSGAAVTESLIGIGAGDGDCVSDTFTAQSCTIGGTAISSSSSSSQWKTITAAWSMEGSTTAAVSTRHDHFFSTFGKVGFITRLHTADMLADVRRTAAAEGIQYVEVMVGLGQGTGGTLAESLMPAGGPWTASAFSSASSKILSDPSVATEIKRTRTSLDTWENAENAALGCGTSHAEAACDVTVRYLVQGVRIASRESVFGQFVYGFALAQQEPRVVGVNLVQAEDDPKSLKNYHDQMVGIGWVVSDAKKKNMSIPISLHAGELTPAFGSAADLKFHVREAVEIAGASRIGHATDTLGEDNADDLINEMAQKGIGVEACLTSNQQLLDVEGADHPARTLLDRGVGVSFATDDQGILRINMNDEITRAIATQELTYHEIKRAIRASLAHSFLPGTPIAKLTACHKSLVAEKLSSTCETALADDERATAEWQLETALDDFEKSL